MHCFFLATDECGFYYLTQPIQTFTCNPYHQLSSRIRLECIAYAVDNVPYEIQWLRSNQSDQSVLTNTNGVRIRNNIHKNILRSRLTIFSVNENDAGIYWCQIVLLQDDRPRERTLKPSQETLLEAPYKYDGLPPCPPTSLHDARTACAGDRDRVAQADPTMPLTPDPNVDDGSVLTPSVPTPVSCVLPTPLTSPTTHCDDPLLSESPTPASAGIPSWAYGLLIGGAAVGILATSVCVVVVVAVVAQRRRRVPLKIRRSHNGEVIFITSS